jgi:DedD protein
MTLPSSEEDLKIRARRRLIGAVALTLLAVIVLPLLLEDEPPPAGPLAVRMTTAPDSAPPAEQGRQDPPVAAPAPPPSTPQPVARPEPRIVQPPAAAKPAPKPDPVKPKPLAPPPKPAPKPTLPAKASAGSEAFVVQLAALSDAGKARELQARAAKAGLPAYSDKAGSLTRVRVGPYATREAAVAAAVKLAENGMTGQVLLDQ